tara:strand:- start:6714 stop:6935 length:222 start_codon:yes stop_codon:yes gene_type:complete
LQSVSLGYTLSLKEGGIKKIKIFGSMSNVFTITNYTGVDPEISTMRFVAGIAGVDNASSPLQSSLTLGVSLTF